MCEVKEEWHAELGTECPLLQLPAGLLEQLLALLPLPALASLATTCTQLDAAVGEFLRHQCRASNTEAKLVTFLARCSRRPGAVIDPTFTPAESKLYFLAGADMVTERRELYRQLATRPLPRLAGPPAGGDSDGELCQPAAGAELHLALLAARPLHRLPPPLAWAALPADP